MKRTIIHVLIAGGIAMILTGFSFKSTIDPNTPRVRKPVYAGSWYPGNHTELKTALNRYLDSADVSKATETVIGLVAPHAGYVYSGPVAAYAYKTIIGKTVDIVILFGNAHREGFRGAAIDDAAAYETPLGIVEVDVDLARTITEKSPSTQLYGTPHLNEHSIETQIPFLQQTLKQGFKIVPILFGYESADAEKELAGILPELLKEKSCIFISSTDLTHFPSYENANRIDRKTAEIISSMDVRKLIDHEDQEMAASTSGLACVLCGAAATRTVMTLSRKLGADSGRMLKYANSGDVPHGDRSRVVGYCAVAFVKSSPEDQAAADEMNAGMELTEPEKTFLLEYSRNVMTEFVKTGKARKIKNMGRLGEILRGAFVSLHIGHELRGCIGYIEPIANCLDVIYDNTISACARDPRFSPVTAAELDSIHIEISILTPPEAVREWTDICIGRHGIILEKGRHRSVFLPQVAPVQGWDLETTLNHLSRKAGLPLAGWREGATFHVFEAQVFSESAGN